MGKMDDELPSDYDIIVVGTGVPESIIAGAAARIGKRVLHLDRRAHYGALWASYNLEGLREILRSEADISTSDKAAAESSERQFNLEENEELLAVSQRSFIENFEEIINVPENKLVGEPDSPGETASVVSEETPQVSSDTPEVKSDGENSNSAENGEVGPAEPEATPIRKTVDWTLEDLLSKSRKFNLDLAPRYLFSRGALVELLISSNIARYAEFKVITRVLTWRNDNLEQVPCSRADVFTTRHVSVVDKHALMKLLQFCAQYDEHPEEYRDFENRPFRDFLRHRKVSDSVIFYVLHSIAMCEPDVLTPVGLRETQKFLRSLGRYGNSPFLCCLYGAGEIPQCFCRLCAVFGGLYHLCRGVDFLVRDKTSRRIKAVISDGKRFNCGNVVLEPTYFVEGISKKATDEIPRVSRGIVISNESILPTEKEPISLLRVPSNVIEGVSHSTLVQEMGPGVFVCPEGSYTLQLSSRSIHSKPRDDLEPVLSAISSKNPDFNTLLAWYFTCLESEAVLDDECGVYITSSPGLRLDYDHHIKEAEEIFRKMCPGDEFLPRAPDPDEIILDFDQGNSENKEDCDHQPSNEVSPDSEVPPASEQSTTQDDGTAEKPDDGKISETELGQSDRQSETACQIPDNSKPLDSGDQ